MSRELTSLNLKLAFKDLYKPESTREEGTLKYFREKLKRKNVSADVKHYEGCEQFFETIGRYTINFFIIYSPPFILDDSYQVALSELGEN